MAIATQNWLDRRAYPFASSFLDSEGGRMHYVDQGFGEPFVFVHGLPTWSFLFRNLIRALSRDYRCIAPDHIGFGLSDKPTGFSQSPLIHRNNLEHLVDHLGLDGITLVLHNMGGPIGLSYAVDHPERIKRIILFNTWMYDLAGDTAIERACKTVTGALGHTLVVKMNQMPKMALNLMCEKAHVVPEFARAISGPFEQLGARENAYQAAKQVLGASPFYGDIWMNRRKLREIPMLLLWGMKDRLWGEKHLNRIWHEYPLAEVETFADAGHLVMEEKPVQVLNVIKRHLATVKHPAAHLY